MVARLLADPLRRAWVKHTTPPLKPCCQSQGIVNCDTAWALLQALPHGDRETIWSTVRG